MPVRALAELETAAELKPKDDEIELAYATEWAFLEPSEHAHPWPFDLEWMQTNDPTAALLINDEGFREWIPVED